MDMVLSFFLGNRDKIVTFTFFLAHTLYIPPKEALMHGQLSVSSAVYNPWLHIHPPGFDQLSVCLLQLLHLKAKFTFNHSKKTRCNLR